MGGVLVIMAMVAEHWVGSVAWLAGLQAVGSGLVLWGSVRPRWIGVAVGAGLLGVVGLAARDAPGAVPLLVPGLGHALLYGAMLVGFGGSLRPGRVAVVTRLATRLNPAFRAGMVPYTRAVTRAWVGFAAVQLLGSAALLGGGAWWAWVTWLHPVLAIGLALGEFAVRRRRFPGEHTSLIAMVRGISGSGVRS